jgi:hypothetical protein
MIYSAVAFVGFIGIIFGGILFLIGRRKKAA